MRESPCDRAVSLRLNTSRVRAGRGVVFVIDSAQPIGLPCAAVELLEVLANPTLAGKPLLVVLNKW